MKNDWQTVLPLAPVQEKVGEFLSTFKEGLPAAVRRRASITIDQVLQTL